MKTITISFPNSIKEVKEKLINLFKFIRSPKRRKHNAKVLRELEKELCNTLNSGYWSADISETMRSRLTCGYPNGVINRQIREAFNKLK